MGIEGKLTSTFGYRYGYLHRGIDIWNRRKAATVIRSSKSGVMTRAGYSSSYGNLVVVKHPGGWETYYAHMKRILVGKGQMVGYMGHTGHATGYHLHFEVRKNGKALNPLTFLNK